jgi:aconitate hydratase
MSNNPFNAKKRLATATGTHTIYSLDAVAQATGYSLDRLPYSIKVLLESALRNLDGFNVTQAHVESIARYGTDDVGIAEIPFNPGRVVLQDFTGVPAVVDFAALRSAMERMGGDVEKVNPLIRADLVIDHSVQVDEYGTPDAITANTKREFERNQERYEFLKWGQSAFSNFSVVPPETGIIHQVNLEYLASCVLTVTKDGESTLLPDSLVGTDSHTTMINGLGVLGWGVGGIEAEAAMLGQPIYMLIPEVVGFELRGDLCEGVTATDLVLTITQMLRNHGVVGKFVEFYGAGLKTISLADRATIANMAPEYGATMGFFPIDEKTLDYLQLSGRDEALIETVETYCKAQGLWGVDREGVAYASTLGIDMGTVIPSLAGYKRPQDRISLSDMKSTWRDHTDSVFNRKTPAAPISTSHRGEQFDMVDGNVVIAAITSCTNTSNPSVMIAAGLVAKKAVALGLKAKPWVKTSLAPGSRVVSDYLDAAGLTEHLNTIGFYTVGYGCAVCIGNSGPLPKTIADAIDDGDLLATAVLSGNRNFEGRVSPRTRGNYLASPPLVVAYSLAGNVDIDLTTEPLAHTADGTPVMLADVWPSNDEINAALASSVKREQFVERYSDVFKGRPAWQKLNAPEGQVFSWSDASTYIQEPPFFVDMPDNPVIGAISAASVIAKLGHSITTDHISPAGAIPEGSPAERYLLDKGVSKRDFNSFGSRRGNDQVMCRGTFGNIRIRNELAPGTEGGFTTYNGPSEQGDTASVYYKSDMSPAPGEVCSIFDASVKYQAHGISLVVLAGKDYGMGSSRDWAAKGTQLLGIKAVIAESYERIHRSNLVGMGVLPLQFLDGQTADTLGLDGSESYDIAIDDNVTALANLTVTATRTDNSTQVFQVLCRIDTPVEVDYYRNGGILHTVLRRLASE